MYQSTNLMFYAESDTNPKSIINILTSKNAFFKELRNLGLAFSCMKNPNNFIILLIKTKQTLNRFKAISKSCHNYQTRVFVVYEQSDIADTFFENSCTITKLEKLNTFITQSLKSRQLFTPHQPSKLLTKLITMELTNLDISPKYTGFKYLVDLLLNTFDIQDTNNQYIDLFEYVANVNLASIDTIERDVRHMLLSTWKNSLIFKTQLLPYLEFANEPNSKKLLHAIISYVKQAI